ncbi:hypothetical protein FRB94_008358 [Tulasnella sp. JGI-2019a]|nr:hypothetical protein FRB93_004316 [Tulasnella sp. JGI-2019a]KAG8996405.1 hypothetical protein FRB94_008358 [Tulasnella sp. JGI-2019a]
MIIAYDIIFPHRFEDPVFMAQDNAISVAVLANIIAGTWYSTGPTCYRLWSMERQKRAAFGDERGDWSDSTTLYSKVMRVLVQSGMLHSLALLAFIACILTQNTAGTDIIDWLNVRITGIAATLIILQLKARTSEVDPSNTRQSANDYSVPVFVHPTRTVDTDASSADADFTNVNHAYLTSSDSKSQSPGTSTSKEDSHV